MDGLARVVAGASEKLVVYVLVMTPSEAEEGWQKTDVWDAAERIAGVHVISDRDAVEAQIFGARTSGQTLLYSPDGNLVFRGGLTASRGHAGPSLGQESILSLLHGQPAEVVETDVFGCALTARTDVAQHEN
jgi:hypothetical protein